MKSTERFALCAFLAVIAGCAHVVVQRSPSQAGPGNPAPATTIPTEYPILYQVQQNGAKLAPTTRQWMQSWLGLNLDAPTAQFPKFTGSTSVNLKIQTVSGKKGKAQHLGLFLATCDTGEPNTELAYFNLSAIVGWDLIFRPAARYELGPKARSTYLKMLTSALGGLTCPPPASPPAPSDNTDDADNATPLSCSQQGNAKNIEGWLQGDQPTNASPSGAPLKGCLKAEKDPNSQAADNLIDPDATKNFISVPDWTCAAGATCPPIQAGNSNGLPDLQHPIIAALQATNPMPTAGTNVVALSIPGANGAPANVFSGDLLELATEYSVIMTFDAVFQQGDRYSGGNIGITKINGVTHFYSMDNGGGELDGDQSSVLMNLAWFSRYDSKTLNALKDVSDFLNGTTKSYLGYTDPSLFVADLGFYFKQNITDDQEAVQDALQTLQRNLKLLFQKVDYDLAQHPGKVLLTPGYPKPQ